MSSKNPARPKMGKSKRSKRIEKSIVRNVRKEFAAGGVGKALYSIVDRKEKDGYEEIVVEGEDLIMPTPYMLSEAESTTGEQIFLSVTANPSYWVGTRISALAQGYQLYRPLMFEAQYVPQVPVTFPGNVIYGTFFNDGKDMNNLQQSLVSSNGGGITPCYNRIRSIVELGKKFLPQEQYHVRGNASSDNVNPFSWVATYTGRTESGASSTTPGWVMVRWRYRLSNGVGSGDETVDVTYQNTEEITRQLSTHFAHHGLHEHRLRLGLFGTVIGALKTLGLPLLKNIGAMFLQNALGSSSDGRQVSLPPGRIYAVDNNFVTAPVAGQNANVDTDATVEIRDDVGNRWAVPDDTPVVIYQQGSRSDDDSRSGWLIDNITVKSSSSSSSYSVTVVDGQYVVNTGTEQPTITLTASMQKSGQMEYPSIWFQTMSPTMTFYEVSIVGSLVHKGISSDIVELWKYGTAAPGASMSQANCTIALPPDNKFFGRTSVGMVMRVRCRASRNGL